MGDFAAALAGALESSGVELAQLQRRLAANGTPVALTTLSMWRSGQREPAGHASLDAVAAIESILGLSPSWLEARIGPRMGRGTRRDTAHVEFDELVGSPAFDAAARQQLGVPHAAELVQSGVRFLVDVDLGGDGTTFVQQIVWRAERDDAQVACVFAKFDHLSDVVPTMTARRGCTITGTHADLARGMVAYAVALEEPLDAGQFGMTEFALSGFPATDLAEGVYLVAERPMYDAAVQVRFLSWRPASATARITTTQSIDRFPARFTGASLLLVRRNFGPGTLGFEWS